MTADAEKAWQILRAQKFAILATASLNGEPWVSPVFFNYETPLRFIWESAHEARHSRLIAENPRLAAVLMDPDSTNDALYLDCTASEVPVDRLPAAIDVFLKGPHDNQVATEREVEDYAPEKPLRLYEAVPVRAYLLLITHDADGHRVDTRIEIDLSNAIGP